MAASFSRAATLRDISGMSQLRSLGLRRARCGRTSGKMLKALLQASSAARVSHGGGELGEVERKGLGAAGADGEGDRHSFVRWEQVAPIVDEDLVQGEVCPRGLDGGVVVETDGKVCRGVGLDGEGGVGVDGEGGAPGQGCGAFDLEDGLLWRSAGGGVVAVEAVVRKRVVSVPVRLVWSTRCQVGCCCCEEAEMVASQRVSAPVRIRLCIG